ncbi:MAG TPA: protoporphyrinogen oxidase [Acidimicrobiales bacterium]|nr:protoporphyrinogen oxidase [Acidimicrobiales bacterium]
MPPTIAVIGAGMAGLSAAWELSRMTPAPRVIVLEADDRLGGKLRTESFGGRPVDLGPDAFVARRPEALALCAELGLTEDLVAPGLRGAYVWARGRLRPLPAGLALGVPTRFGPLARSGICSPAGLVGPALDLLRRRRPPPEPSARPTDMAVGEVVRRRLGPEVTARLAAPLIGGIHAGDIDLMSAAAVFPALLGAEARRGSLMRALGAGLPGPPAASPGPDLPDLPGVAAMSGAGGPVFLSLRGGIGRLAEELGRALLDRGVELRRGTTATVLRRQASGDGERWCIASAPGGETEADGVVVAVPAPVAAGLLRRHDGALAAILDTVSYASVAIVTLRLAADAVRRPLDGSGFLVPRPEAGGAGPLVTACTWISAKWPELDRPGDVLIRASVGRQGDDRHVSMTDDELRAACLEGLGTMMGLGAAPLETAVTRWPGSFPQYPVGHLDRVAAIEAATDRLPGLALAGAALHGVGIPACIGSGRRAARAVVA